MSNPFSRISQVNSISEISCYRYRYFSALFRYFDYWDEQHKKNGFSGISAEIIQELRGQYRYNPSWYTDKFAKFPDFDSLVKTREFLHWEEYNDFRRKIEPLVKELKMNTFAEVLQPKFVYNDKGLGVFDFAKASTVLLPSFIYYSVKYKKVVEESEVKIIQKDDKFLYELKKDKSKVVLLPAFQESDNLEKAYDDLVERLDKADIKELISSGYVQELVNKYNLTRKVYSTVKKTFLYKENLPKPKKAVRILVYVGGSSGRSTEELFYNGFTAIVCAELLEEMGYSVSIVAVFGKTDNIRLTPSARCQELSNNYRVSITAVELKKYSESLDIDSLLACTSESYFFRGTVFWNWLNEIQLFNDPSGMGLGFPLDREQIRQTAFFSLGVRDNLYVPGKDGKFVINEQSPLLYYLFADIYSEQDAMKQIRNLILSVEDENREMRERIYASLQI